MKRPMCLLAASWLAGLLLAGRWPEFETNYILITYFFLIIVGLFILNKNPRWLHPYVQPEWYPKLTLLLALLPCLFLAGFWRMEQEMEQRIAAELPWTCLEEEGESYVTLEGTVRAKFCETQVTLELTDCVIIGYYGEENQPAGDCRVTLDAEGKEWLPETYIGNRIRVFGKFSTFRPATNPGQFDARSYYIGKGLFADVSALRISVLHAETDKLGHGMYVLKQRMKESLLSLYPQEKAGVLSAMLLGDKDLLSEEVETLYRQNGISHILAISGLHISLLCMGLYRALRKFTLPVKIATGITICFLCFYIVFTGASTSSLRAGVMCLVMLGSKLFRRSYDLLSSLSLAAIVVTALRPTEFSSAGFLLSFGAVLGVAVAQEVEHAILEAREEKAFLWNVFLFGGMIQCMTLPISLWFFYELSPYSILLNLIVIPLVALLLGGGILSAILGMFWPAVAGFPAGGTYLLLEFYAWLCRMTQKLPFSFVLLGRPEVWQIVVYYGALAVVLHLFFKRNIKSPVRWLCVGILCAVSILFLPGSWNAKLLFLDVSQGDSVLISTADGTVILSDCGSSDVSKVGEYRLSPVLKQNGTLLLDMAVVSHMDSDHTSGIKELLMAMPVYEGSTHYAANYQGAVGIRELVLPKVKEKSEAYLELENLALEKNVAVRYVQAGEQLYQEEELLIECLSPRDAKESENDTSLVFLMQTPQLLVWLMGDAGAVPEAELMERLAAVHMDALRENKQVLLKVGHHGSKTSSSADFIDFVQPDISIISCGYQNSYGHPHAIVLERLKAEGSTVFRTDLQGAVIVELGSGKGILVRNWLKNQRE